MPEKATIAQILLIGIMKSQHDFQTCLIDCISTAISEKPNRRHAKSSIRNLGHPASLSDIIVGFKAYKFIGAEFKIPVQNRRFG
ncbi:hypothetical protein C0081_20360 [Cohaesibacter celericrescens]|uniref:Uncharacterized protein n=1 Tax=Cohaesibacter celericrescens TaxID=2067669 RepID=A0A2N5XLP9_9HYPH|nr:hypothetical protein C0081_20360 [Cohaesibacter celericrescens]